jgi:uncharacterized protein
MISFDGPQNVQNYNRKFSNSGKGTFDSVMKKIINLKQNHKKYFKNNVTFNAVYLNDMQKKEAEKFFSEIKIIDKVRFADADLKGVDFIDFQRPFLKSTASSSDEIRNADWYTNRMQQLNDKNTIPHQWHHSGPCIPGIRRLFVDTNGEFFTCEKFIESMGLSIGSLEKGFDIDAIMKLLNIGELTENDCIHCFAFRFCSICCTHCIDPIEGNLSKLSKKAECENQKKIASVFFHESVRR